MGRRALAVLTVVATLLNPCYPVKFAANDEGVAITNRPKFRHESTAHHAREWIDGPDGRVYQFHVGEQSWLAAREFCLSQNSELVVLTSKEQIDWLLSHYAPTYTRFNERYMQIGLMMPDGPNRDWTYLDGSKYDQSVIAWMSGEPFDHSADGRERCAVLRVHARVLDDVDCEAVPNPQVHMRFVCERDQTIHKQQQKSQNFIWSKLEKLLEYFGFSSGTMPTTKPYNETDSELDYIDEIAKLNISSKEREELKGIKVDHETSSEEQKAVESVLRTLNKISQPGANATPKIPEAEDLTSKPASQEDRPHTSSELLTDPTVMPKQFQENNEKNKETSESPTTTGNAESASQPSSSVATATSEAANEVSSTTDTAASTSQTPSGRAARARAAPLKEIPDIEGSGTEMERSDIEDSSKLHHEIDPEKLEKVISTMEKMIESLEKVHVKGEKTEEKKEEGEAKREKSEEDSKKQVQKKKKEKSGESLLKINEKFGEDNETAKAMEKDFDEEASKNLPSTDIKPPEEECDEEASGLLPGTSVASSSTTSTNEEIIRNTVDTEDVDDLSQKPKIPAEKEGHIQDFLTTLRTFLSRAEHSDLRKLLDEHPEKTLLEKMKIAIKTANEREFERLKELELMKKHGVDISNIPEPKLMGENEREELYNKISRVVMVEAEKKGEETITQPSARTTTQELHRSTNAEVQSKKILIRKSSKEFISKEEINKNGKLKDAKPVTKKGKEAKTSERKAEEKKEEKENSKKDEPTKSADDPDKEETTDANPNIELPLRTVQLKEFEEKEEIMSKESRGDVKESGEVKEVKEKKEEREQKKDNDEDEKEESKDGFVKNQPLSGDDLKELSEKKNDEDKEKEENEEVKSTESDEEKKAHDKEFVKNEPLTANDLEDPKVTPEEAKEKDDDDDEDKPAQVSPYPPDTNLENDDDLTKEDDDLTKEDDSLDQSKEDKSKDNSYDSQQVDKDDILTGDAITEAPEEEIPTYKIPAAENEDDGEEVATMKTPEAIREEKRRLEKAKRRKDQRLKRARKTGNTLNDLNDDANGSKESRETVNPFTLPTLPTLPPLGSSPPTLPPITPMPGFDNLLQTISKQWRQIFPNARIPTFNPDEDD